MINYKYYLYISFRSDVNFYSKLKLDYKLGKKVKNIITIYCKNFYYS